MKCRVGVDSDTDEVPAKDACILSEDNRLVSSESRLVESKLAWVSLTLVLEHHQRICRKESWMF